jgi:hypothetical protein
LRFFDSHFKAIKYILKETNSIFVDFHNQRLHAVISKPYDNEQQRLDRAVTIAQIIIDVVEQQRDAGVDDIIEAAKLRIGIDTGKQQLIMVEKLIKSRSSWVILQIMLLNILVVVPKEFI